MFEQHKTLYYEYKNAILLEKTNVHYVGICCQWYSSRGRMQLSFKSWRIGSIFSIFMLDNERRYDTFNIPICLSHFPSHLVWMACLQYVKTHLKMTSNRHILCFVRFTSEKLAWTCLIATFHKQCITYAFNDQGKGEFDYTL